MLAFAAALGVSALLPASMNRTARLRASLRHARRAYHDHRG
jgi:hypothetical protein